LAKNGDDDGNNKDDNGDISYKSAQLTVSFVRGGSSSATDDGEYSNLNSNTSPPLPPLSDTELL
jgi:hypothetical protein